MSKKYVYCMLCGYILSVECSARDANTHCMVECSARDANTYTYCKPSNTRCNSIFGDFDKKKKFHLV